MFTDFAAKVVGQLPGAAAGVFIGCFIPAVLRKVHAFVVKEATAVKTEAKTLAGDIKKKL